MIHVGLLAQITAQTVAQPGVQPAHDPMFGSVTNLALRVSGAVLTVCLAWFAAGWAREAARRALERADFDATLGRFFSNALRWVILLLASFGCLAIFGIEPMSFVAVLGAAGLAIGLGFQGSLSHLASGVMLLIFRPFKVGDAVNVAGQSGVVNQIDLFTTELDTADGRRIILPNGQIFGAVIENISHHPIPRADVVVGVAYDADIDRTRQVLDAAAAAVPGRVSDPEPEVYLMELGASSVNWRVGVWCRNGDYLAVRQATVRGVKRALDEAGIGIPFPQMDVRVTQAKE